jgi:hypothetical protein
LPLFKRNSRMSWERIWWRGLRNWRSRPTAQMRGKEAAYPGGGDRPPLGLSWGLDKRFDRIEEDGLA